MSVLIGRAINKNQLLILQGIKTRSGLTITGILNRISVSCHIALSTLKSNLKVLESMGLIQWKRGEAASLTDFGERVLITIENADGLEFNRIKSLMMV